MKYFIMILMSVFLFTATPMVSADNSVVKPIKKSPVIQEVFNGDVVAYMNRYQRERYERMRRERMERRQRRERRERIERRNRYHRRYHHPRPRGCFIDTISEQSLLSWLLNK